MNDVSVVGAGRAGCEATLAAPRSSPDCSRASPIGGKSKPSCNWLFGCLSTVRNTSYPPLHLTPIKRPFEPSGLVTLLCPLLTSVSWSGSLAASSVRPDLTRPDLPRQAQPPSAHNRRIYAPHLRWKCTSRPAAHSSDAHACIRFLSIGSRTCSTLHSDIASRQCPCASLTHHLHQVG